MTSGSVPEHVYMAVCDERDRYLREAELRRKDYHAQVARATKAENRLAEAERERDEAIYTRGNTREMAHRLSGVNKRNIARAEAAEADRDRYRDGYAALRSWSDRMPDAGFTDASPRWGWWHERPAALGSEQKP